MVVTYEVVDCQNADAVTMKIRMLIAARVFLFNISALQGHLIFMMRTGCWFAWTADFPLLRSSEFAPGGGFRAMEAPQKNAISRLEKDDDRNGVIWNR